MQKLAPKMGLSTKIMGPSLRSLGEISLINPCKLIEMNWGTSHSIRVTQRSDHPCNNKTHLLHNTGAASVSFFDGGGILLMTSLLWYRSSWQNDVFDTNTTGMWWGWRHPAVNSSKNVQVPVKGGILTYASSIVRLVRDTPSPKQTTYKVNTSILGTWNSWWLHEISLNYKNMGYYQRIALLANRSDPPVICYCYWVGGKITIISKPELRGFWV